VEVDPLSNFNVDLECGDTIQYTNLPLWV